METRLVWALAFAGALDALAMAQSNDYVQIGYEASLGTYEVNEDQSLWLVFDGIGKRSWIHACHSGVSRATVPAA